LRRIFSRATFTVSSPIDTGCGTAFLGSLGLGLIPVGYADIEGDQRDSVLTDSPSIEALREAVRCASTRSVEWCRDASRRTLERYARLHAPPVFGENFRQMLIELGI
jgi:hypothetical protein